MKTAFKTKKVVPDYDQLEKTKVLVKCNGCKANYSFWIMLDLAKNYTKCPWCERVQAFDWNASRSAQAPSVVPL